MQNQSGGGHTGTPDTTYNLTAILYHALQGVENCQTYEQDAQGDEQLGQFFREAGEQQRQLAEKAKVLLHDRLMQETQGGKGDGAAFSFGEQQQSDEIARQPVSAGSTGIGQQGDPADGQPGASERY